MHCEPGTAMQEEQLKSRGIFNHCRSRIHSGIGKSGKSCMLGKAHKWGLRLASPIINQ